MRFFIVIKSCGISLLVCVPPFLPLPPFMACVSLQTSFCHWGGGKRTPPPPPSKTDSKKKKKSQDSCWRRGVKPLDFVGERRAVSSGQSQPALPVCSSALELLSATENWRAGMRVLFTARPPWVTGPAELGPEWLSQIHLPDARPPCKPEQFRAL